MTPERIKKIMERFRIGRGQLADMSGSSPSTIQYWVKGKQQPSGSKLILLEALEEESIQAEKKRLSRISEAGPPSATDEARTRMALRSKTKRPILTMLAKEPMSIGKMAKRMKVTKQAVSWTTKEMHEDELIDRYRKGQWIICEIHPRIRPLVEAALAMNGVDINEVLV